MKMTIVCTDELSALAQEILPQYPCIMIYKYQTEDGIRYAVEDDQDTEYDMTLDDVEDIFRHLDEEWKAWEAEQEEKEMKKYVVVDDCGTDIYLAGPYDTAEEAEAEADSQFNRLTTADKKRRSAFYTALADVIVEHGTCYFAEDLDMDVIKEYI